MLPLKYLFQNIDLAAMLLKNWHYDSNDTNLFSFWRISSNAVYGFKQQGQTCYLRFSPTSEKNPEQVSAELNFLSYLKQNGFPCTQPLMSKNNRQLEVVDTPWGSYQAAAFQAVPGENLEQADLGIEGARAYGRLLGQLHLLSQSYQPQGQSRDSYTSKLQWIDNTLAQFPGQDLGRQEVKLLSHYFSKLEPNSNTYGLVHFDFEPDNVFYDSASGKLSAIDFDDAMYHFYAVDIAKSLEAIRAGEFKSSDEVGIEESCELFLSGYQEIFPAMIVDKQLFSASKRFMDLYGYTRILNAVAESWQNEPEWMANLRGYLGELLQERSQAFGKLLD